LYRYDAISRLRDANLAESRSADDAKYERIEEYLSLGPLGTALAPRPAGDHRPRILLIDELDKSDVDLPNDLLDLFEEGYFHIDELVRIKDRHPTVALRTAYSKTAARDETILVSGGHVQCQQFPIVVITSNEERQFPPAFLRRCLRHHVKTRTKPPEADRPATWAGRSRGLIAKFAKQRDGGA
jgi:MoxR-like ATPase